MKRPRLGRAVALACAFMVGVSAIGIAQQQVITGTFTTRQFESLPAASSLGPSDGVAIVQGGATKKWLPYNYFLDHTASNIANIPATLKNLLGNRTAHTYPAEAYGSCTWDDTHDVGPCINAAITAALAGRTSDASYTYGGATVVVPAGLYGLSTTILQNVKTGITIRGAGGAGAGICRTALVWVGAVGGTMAQMGEDSLNQIIGGGFEDICLLGNDLAGTGLKMRSAIGGRYTNVFVENATSRAVDMNPSTNDTNGVSDNVFTKFKIALTSAAAINADGWYFGNGTTNNNTFGNTWIDSHVKYQNGKAVRCGNADSNTFYGLTAQPVSGGTGRSIHMLGSATNSLLTCRHNRFYARNDLGSTNANTAPLADTDTFPSLANYVWQNVGSGGQLPTYNGSATITYETSTGQHFSNSATQFVQGGLSFKPSGQNGAVLDIDQANNSNGAGAMKAGPTIPLYLLYNSPTIGFNALVNNSSQWIFGKGSSSNYGGRIRFDKTSGFFKLVGTLTPGNEDGLITDAELMTVDRFGHVWVGNTTAPAISCSGGGGGATVAGTDRAGLMTIPSGNTSCTLTFANAYATAPFCTVTWQTSLASMAYAIATTTITLTQTAPGAQLRVNYNCLARDGG